MSGPLRLEFAGAVYHVTSRGDRRKKGLVHGAAIRCACMISLRPSGCTSTPAGSATERVPNLLPGPRRSHGKSLPVWRLHHGGNRRTFFRALHDRQPRSPKIRLFRAFREMFEC